MTFLPANQIALHAPEGRWTVGRWCVAVDDLVDPSVPVAELLGPSGMVPCYPPCLGLLRARMLGDGQRVPPSLHLGRIEPAPVVWVKDGQATMVCTGGRYTVPGSLKSSGGGSHPFMGDAESFSYGGKLYAAGDHVVLVITEEKVLYTTTTSHTSYVTRDGGRSTEVVEGDAHGALPLRASMYF